MVNGILFAKLANFSHSKIFPHMVYGRDKFNSKTICNQMLVLYAVLCRVLFWIYTYVCSVSTKDMRLSLIRPQMILEVAALLEIVILFQYFPQYILIGLLCTFRVICWCLTHRHRQTHRHTQRVSFMINYQLLDMTKTCNWMINEMMHTKWVRFTRRKLCLLMQPCFTSINTNIRNTNVTV